jgi:hypothetical protein
MSCKIPMAVPPSLLFENMAAIGSVRAVVEAPQLVRFSSICLTKFSESGSGFYYRG